MDICLGFAAGLTDKETGLVHLGYREYDPAIGRFITPDPLGFAGGDVDVYGYCLDDPINFHDRTGLAGKSEGKEQGTYSKIASGLHKAATAIPKGLEKAADKSTEGIKKATTEGGKAASKAIVKGSHAAKEAIEKTADEFKNNKELQKYTGIALGAGSVPIALAGGAAVAPAIVQAGIATSGAVEKFAQETASRIATRPNLLKNLKRGYDFASAFNSGELPPVSWAGALGTAIANRDRIRETFEEIKK
ncbi:RHS repeat-associated core domain-containing protein [Desulfovibrio gilichinskyi]|uniref:RHS repeat-associated core domain-containing protein n=1 Tax=Desulfovibrio gilichinskyi TaxID=1519643 RepID=UPI001BB00509|nr:RHS repeat-associated core domain-containing protein [Desulfovibrio gilichinskyi]